MPTTNPFNAGSQATGAAAALGVLLGNVLGPKLGLTPAEASVALATVFATASHMIEQWLTRDKTPAVPVSPKP